MPTITLEDVKVAIQYAWNLWGKDEARVFSFTLDSGQDVTIILDKSGGMLNYGFPNIYTMDKSNIPALKTWCMGR